MRKNILQTETYFILQNLTFPLFASGIYVIPVGEVENMGFACQRHAILITPHKRNEVERSVGLEGADWAGVSKTRYYLRIKKLHASGTQVYVAH